MSLRQPLSVCLLCFAVSGSSWAQEAVSPSLRPVHTYSIVARDPASGQLGVAVQSHWFSVGTVVPWARAGVGAVATQSNARIAYGPELLTDLEQGLGPAEALRQRTSADPHADVRQVALINASGQAAAFTGERCIAEAGHFIGSSYSVQANIMANDQVVTTMAQAYEAAEGDFAERLLQALEGAQRAGGDLRGKQSAALLIVSGAKQDHPWEGIELQLNVEDHSRPLQELRRLVQVHRAYEWAHAGDEAMAAGRYEEALQHYSAAQNMQPENVELMFWSAVFLLENHPERDDEALEILQQVFRRDARWVDMPQRLFEKGHLRNDRQLMKKLAALQPEFSIHRAVANADPQRIEADIRKLASFGTRHTLSDTKSKKRGIGAARRWLEKEFERISKEYHDGRLKVELTFHELGPARRMPQGVRLGNVVATLPGEDPDRLVVVSGHFDSRAGDPLDAESDAPGANDDASGTAAVLEAARLLGGLRPRATIVFMAVAGEEQGLFGARALAHGWREAGQDVVGMFTMDIVGGATGSSGKKEPWRMRVFSEGVPTRGNVVGSDNDSSSRQLARYLKRAAAQAVPGFEITLVFRQDRFLRGGDHKPFNEIGWPAIRITEPHENYTWQHQNVEVVEGVQYGDLPDNVDFDYVGRVTASVTSALGELALAPPSPEDVRIDVRRLTPHSTLSWSAVDSKDLAGYAIVYRRTHEPDWTHRIEVGKVTEYTLEGISKDDWLFGVQAVDLQGRRSLPVYPAPRFR